MGFEVDRADFACDFLHINRKVGTSCEDRKLYALEDVDDCLEWDKLLIQLGNMNKPLDQDDIAAMEGQLRNCVEQDRRYWRVNDVKIDAIHTARTYEEFADRVAAAHLRPMEKGDYKSKSARSWNMCASKEKNNDE